MSNSDKRKMRLIPLNPPLEKGERGDFLAENSQQVSDKPQGEEGSHQKIVILGVGNLILSDEGVGVHVVNELTKMSLPPGVLIIEGGTDGFRLLNVITEADRLIVIDAVKCGAAPGSIYRFNVDDVRSCPSGFKTSVHQIGILEVIDLSGLIGKTPKTTVIGIEPKSLEMGMELSPEVKARIPRVIELVLEEIKG
ncbi:MAG: HyaD/HybD family hydrogenase maturation endopeptidase [Nitrospirota bacterium]